MTIVLRIAVLFVAVLLRAHGLTTADSAPVMAMHQSVAALESALSHDPVAMHAARGGKQCREAGCTFAAAQNQCALMPMIVPELPEAKPFETAAIYGRPAEQRFAVLFSAPPVPPPKSPLLETAGDFFA